MKITTINTGIVNLPANEPLADAAANPNGKRPIVWVTVGTDSGVQGIGVAYFGGSLTGTLRHAIAELGALLVGDDPQLTEGIHKKLFNAAGGSAGPGGVYHLALSALDIAIWDIKAKALDLPLWRLLGGARDRVPTYASGALMRELSLDRVVKAAATLKDKGWKEMKTQLALPGTTTPKIEVERMVKIREAIGPDIKLMCDINQRWRPEQAMDIGRRVEDAGVGLFWLEDVTTADDYPGLARIADALSTPVAGGEYVWGIVPFRHMMEARSVDIPMVDLVRVGGITQWLKVAGMAEAFNLPVVSHLIPEVHVHLIAAVPNGLTVEYMPWLGMLFKEVPEQQNGELVMPKAPGLGIEFDQAVLDKYKA
ncbi:MAG TPA: mandelate racemase/muconate lactonizing enzyme family protein [Stellaceae bacterium]|jgi:L-alanine-DL-glutamate epimerase-like enolase superfamily enzyme|nr:mandelate racemase/muconate lactonizing enzyme family protein [Stellaceae bacterium]